MGSKIATRDVDNARIQGAAMLANLSQDVPMNARSNLMSALINEGDTKRRCVEGPGVQ